MCTNAGVASEWGAGAARAAMPRSAELRCCRHASKCTIGPHLYSGGCQALEQLELCAESHRPPIGQHPACKVGGRRSRRMSAAASRAGPRVQPSRLPQPQLFPLRCFTQREDRPHAQQHFLQPAAKLQARQRQQKSGGVGVGEGSDWRLPGLGCGQRRHQGIEEVLHRRVAVGGQ